MMDRAERTGLGVAVVLHAALFAALSLNLLKPVPLPRLETSPIEVTLSDEVAPVSTAPVFAPEPAPPSEPVTEPIAPPPAPAPMQRPAPQPMPKPARPVTQTQPRPTAKPVAKPPSKPAARPAQPQRRPGLSRELVSGLRDTPNRSAARPATGTPAAAVSAAVKSSIGAEVRRQLKPHWKSPTGADVELLRTTIAVKLKRDGSLDGAPTLVSQSGVNESNRSQARLHVDQAIKAVRLAAPFKLPAEYYDAWREIRPNFDKRL